MEGLVEDFVDGFVNGLVKDLVEDFISLMVKLMTSWEADLPLERTTKTILERDDKDAF